jgi:hypothetical protein
MSEAKLQPLEFPDERNNKAAHNPDDDIEWYPDTEVIAEFITTRAIHHHMCLVTHRQRERT